MRPTASAKGAPERGGVFKSAPPACNKQSTHHGKGHRVEEEEEVEEVMVRTVATQAPSSLLGVTHGPSLALSSLAHAYKVDGGCSTHFHSGVPSKELLAMSGL